MDLNKFKRHCVDLVYILIQTNKLSKDIFKDIFRNLSTDWVFNDIEGSLLIC